MQCRLAVDLAKSIVVVDSSLRKDDSLSSESDSESEGGFSNVAKMRRMSCVDRPSTGS